MADGADDASWTLLNVDTKSTFEMRHWLVRNAGLGTEQKEFEVNFEARYGKLMQTTFLQACVSIISQRIEDAQRAVDEEQTRKEDSGEVETVAQRLTRQKEERKAAAMERSRLRQQGEGYFDEAKKANEKGTQHCACPPTTHPLPFTACCGLVPPPPPRPPARLPGRCYCDDAYTATATTVPATALEEAEARKAAEEEEAASGGAAAAAAAAADGDDAEEADQPADPLALNCKFKVFAR
jgi:hypothetical protein